MYYLIWVELKNWLIPDEMFNHVFGEDDGWNVFKFFVMEI